MNPKTKEELFELLEIAKHAARLGAAIHRRAVDEGKVIRLFVDAKAVDPID